MTIEVPNTGNYASDRHKDVRVQVTYYDANQLGPPLIDVRQEIFSERVGQDNIPVPGLNDWYVQVEDWRMELNPPEEYVDIYPPGLEPIGQEYMASEVVIDTICVPEPAGVLLLAAAGLMGLVARIPRSRHARTECAIAARHLRVARARNRADVLLCLTHRVQGCPGG